MIHQKSGGYTQLHSQLNSTRFKKIVFARTSRPHAAAAKNVGARTPPLHALKQTPASRKTLGQLSLLELD